jgi:hypothetical protein
MCFNASTSIATFIISLFFCVWLISRGAVQKDPTDIFAGTLTLLIGSMQLIEFFLWKNQKCNKTNHSLSLLLFILLYLQPIIAVITVLLLFKPKGPLFYAMILSCVAITVFMIWNMVILNRQKLCSVPACAQDCRLQWAPLQKKSPLMILFLIFYFIMIALVYLHDYQALFILQYPVRYAVLPVTLLIAVLYSLLVSSKNVFGSTWCFLALLFGPIALLRV